MIIDLRLYNRLEKRKEMKRDVKGTGNHMLNGAERF